MIHIANCCHTVFVIFTKYELKSTPVVTNKVCCSCMHTVVNATFTMYQYSQNLLETVSSVIPENHDLLAFPFYMKKIK